MTEFEGVVPALAQALDKRGYGVLTPVQKAVLSPELKDADLLVSAQTGSGKTVAFGLTLGPSLLGGADQFARAKAPLALAVAPTRELAMQLKRELEWLYASTGAIIASCVGGMDMRAERQALGRGAHIVVGTPGRLRDHIERGSFDTTGLRAVVLDEADEMLDLGFREDLEYILDAAPKERRTLMFSATVPRTIASLAKRYQRNAVRIATTAEQKQHLDIQYRALTVAPNDRENAIINLLRYIDPKSALVFCGTRAMVNHMTSRFTNRGFSVVALSGELSQNERSHALQAMRDGRARVCIATDVAARGIDLPNLDLVVHADIPKNREILLHRSGRTGRAGRKGVCVLIVPHPVRRRTEQLLRSANVEAEWAKPPSLQDIMRVDRERILDDPALSEPLSEDEKTFAGELLARHGAEQVAASFLRMHRAGLPGPEELLDAAPSEERQPRQDGFTGGVWFSLSVGRKHSAEPRWLLPMLCRAGHITKREIGSIKVLADETHVELASNCVDRFLEAVGPSRKVEKTITVTRLEGAASGGSGGDKPHGAKRPYGPAKPGHKRKPFKRPDAAGPGGGAAEVKPWEKFPKKRQSFQGQSAAGASAPTGEVKPWDKFPKKRKPSQGSDAAGPGVPAGEVKPWEKSPKKRKPKKLGKPKRSKLTIK